MYIVYELESIHIAKEQKSFLVHQSCGIASSSLIISIFSVYLQNSNILRKSCCFQRYSNADLKISICVCIYIKTIPWKFPILNPKNSRVICRV